MKKERKSATILKPEIDEQAALRFASAGSEPVPAPSKEKPKKAASKVEIPLKDSPAGIPKDMRQISLTIKKDLYDRIAKEASRKNRTVEEHLKKHLTKRYDK
jgi:hypothetical protein